MRRKMEVLGLVLMVLALLLTLAFVTYQPADDSVAQSAPLVDAFLTPGVYPPVQNALGLLGAELARTLVPGFLGYSILFYSLGLMVWGYAIFRHWDLRPLLYPSGLTVLSSFVLACLIGWFAHTFDADLPRWAGAVGMGISGWMQGVFGRPGSFILIMLVVAVMTLLVVDHDIQRSVDRFIDAIRQIEEKIEEGIDAWNERQARKKREDESDADSTAQAAASDTTASAGTASSGAPTPSDAPSETDRTADAPAPDASASSVRTDDASSSDSDEGTADEDQDAPPADADPSASPDAPGAVVPTGQEEPTAEDESTEDASTPGPIVQVPENAGDGRPLRRNDLFRKQSSSSDDDPNAANDDSSTDELDLEELEEEEEFGEALDDAPSEDAEQSSEPGGGAASDAADSVEPTETEDDAISPVPAPQETPSDAENEPTSEDPPDASPPPDDVELTVKEQVEEEKADDIDRTGDTPEEVEYESPSLDLLDEPTDDDPSLDREELEKNKRIILDKLDTYNIEIDDISAVVGPTVTRYELTPAAGIKVSRITSLEDDLAMALAAPSVRMIAPIPGKSAVGIEIPNSDRELVRLREVLGTAKFRDTDKVLPIPMGKTIEGEVFLADLTKMPHLLIAGATGSGKSVGLNAMLTGLIYACHPMNLRFVIIDPKKIELQQYTDLKTQFVAQPEDVDQTVITDIEEASGVLKSVEKEMEERYDLLSDASVRGIEGYNEKFKAGELSPEDGHRHMPYVVVVVDELADLMMAVGDDIEGPISRLAQMARAVGIHLVLATQRPSVDVITGVIKANFPSRVAYEVASMADSRTILDQGGAEGLVGNGDLLYLSGSDLRRLQGPFVSVEEVEEVVEFVSEQPGVTPYTLPSLFDAGHGPNDALGVDETDEKFEDAARVTVRRQQGSVSLLQRKLAVGYTRAARIVDQLEEAGIVGPHNGTKAREVLVDDEEELERLLKGEEVED